MFLAGIGAHRPYSYEIIRLLVQLIHIACNYLLKDGLPALKMQNGKIPGWVPWVLKKKWCNSNSHREKTYWWAAQLL